MTSHLNPLCYDKRKIKTYVRDLLSMPKGFPWEKNFQLLARRSLSLTRSMIITVIVLSLRVHHRFKHVTSDIFQQSLIVTKVR